MHSSFLMIVCVNGVEFMVVNQCINIKHHASSLYLLSIDHNCVFCLKISFTSIVGD